MRSVVLAILIAGMLPSVRGLAQAPMERVDLKEAVRRAAVDLRAGHEELAHAERQVARARQAAAQAERAVEIATLSYKNGASTNLELIDAQRRARDAETAAALAEDDLQKLRLELLAASGNFP